MHAGAHNLFCMYVERKMAGTENGLKLELGSKTCCLHCQPATMHAVCEIVTAWYKGDLHVCIYVTPYSRLQIKPVES